MAPKLKLDFSKAYKEDPKTQKEGSSKASRGRQGKGSSVEDWATSAQTPTRQSETTSPSKRIDSAPRADDDDDLNVVSAEEAAKSIAAMAIRTFVPSGSKGKEKMGETPSNTRSFAALSSPDVNPNDP